MSRDYSRKEVLEIIANEANGRGIPRDDFLRFAYIETGGAFDERVSRGPNGAKGLFQFVPSTAGRYGIAGRELDPVANTDAAARLYLDNRRDIVASHARTGHPYLSAKAEPDGLDMYVAHQQGAAGYRSIQAAIVEGAFTRGDSRSHILNNVSRRDIEPVTGVAYDRFARMSDQDMARTFARYWQAKYERIEIPEVGVAPVLASGARGASVPAVETPHPPQTSRLTLSRAFDLSVQHDHVHYGLGSKAVASGRIDCSGWVVMLQNTTMNEINAKAGRPIFSRDELFNPGLDAAATIVQKSQERSGILLEGASVTPSRLREGMVIGEDNGRTSFDVGRFRGIDHIVMIVRDPRGGGLMVSQSRGGEGVETIPLVRYLQGKQSRGVRLYATDPLHEARTLIDGPAATVSEGTRDAQSPHPATSAHAADTRVLQYGDAGPAVGTLQRRLFDLDYRGRDGKPLNVDADFGDNTRFALVQFQREHGLEGKGIAGPKTAAALDRAERALVSGAAHPHHALYEQALQQVHVAEKTKGMPAGPHSERIAAALAVECIRRGITQVDRVEISDDRRLVRAVHDRPGNAESGLGNTDMISVPRAANQPLAESSRQCQEVAVDAAARATAREPHRQQPAPALAL